MDQIQALDTRIFSRFKSLPEAEQEPVKEKIVKELKKLEAVEQLKKFGVEVAEYREQFNGLLQQTVASLNTGQTEQAISGLKETVKVEEDAIDLLKAMQDFEDLLIKLTKQELK